MVQVRLLRIWPPLRIHSLSLLGATSKYVNLSPSYKNPGDTGSKQGAKITIDSTAKWNSVSMTEVTFR
jgi:hypothetical protein